MKQRKRPVAKLVGQRFGKRVVTGVPERSGWLVVVCDCGRVGEARASRLRKSRDTSCVACWREGKRAGAKPVSRPVAKLVGQRFGKRVVTWPSGVILVDADDELVAEGSWSAQQPGVRRAYLA